MTEFAIEFERRIEAPPSIVFGFLSTAEGWTQWQGTAAVIEAEVGGAHKVDIRGDGFASGRIVELVPDRRLAFTWGFEHEGHPLPPGSTLIEIDLTPDGDGTILHFRQSAIPEGFEAVGRGWSHYLDRLQLVAAGQAPGPDPNIVTT